MAWVWLNPCLRSGEPEFNKCIYPTTDSNCNGCTYLPAKNKIKTPSVTTTINGDTTTIVEITSGNATTQIISKRSRT